MSDYLVEVEHLQKYFPAGGYGKNKKFVKALDDVSFKIKKGETLGMVGESGCGKTTAGRTLLRLHEPTGGKIIYDGKVLFDKENKIAEDMLPYRKKMQIVFQDPYASLDPRMTVGDIVGEPLDIHKLYSTKEERYQKIIELLQKVGLNSEHANRYPHEFSGGQRQRVGIARALAVNPEFIVCDEPISALDVSIQAQVINMFEDLQKDLGLTYLFIAHDLSVVKHISDRIAVMYLGKMVELADSYEITMNSKHPYTRSLVSAIPAICESAPVAYPTAAAVDVSINTALAASPSSSSPFMMLIVFLATEYAAANSAAPRACETPALLISAKLPDKKTLDWVAI